MAAEEMIMLWDLLGDDDVSLSYITKSEKKTNRFRDVFCLFYKYLKELGVCVVQEKNTFTEYTTVIAKIKYDHNLFF